MTNAFDFQKAKTEFMRQYRKNVKSKKPTDTEIDNAIRKFIEAYKEGLEWTKKNNRS